MLSTQPRGRHVIKFCENAPCHIVGGKVIWDALRETLDIVDRACIIYGGQVLFAGSPEALVADANVRRLYLGEGFTL